MTRILDFEQQRQKQQLKRRDRRAEAMRENFREVREGKSDQQKSTRRLLDIFKSKHPPKQR